MSSPRFPEGEISIPKQHGVKPPAPDLRKHISIVNKGDRVGESKQFCVLIKNNPLVGPQESGEIAILSEQITIAPPTSSLLEPVTYRVRQEVGDGVDLLFSGA